MTAMVKPEDTPENTSASTSVDPADQQAPQARNARRRSIAIALMLGVLVVLFYAATLVHLGGNVANRGM